MKKLSFLFVALALVGFITLSSCKGGGTTEEATEEVVEEAEEVVDEAEEVVDEAAEEVEEAAEEVAE